MEIIEILDVLKRWKIFHHESRGRIKGMTIRRVHLEQINLGYIYYEGVLGGVVVDGSKIIYDPIKDIAVVDPEYDYDWVYKGLSEKQIHRAKAVITTTVAALCAARKRSA
mgnify:FL=1